MDEATFRSLVGQHAQFPTALLNVIQGLDAELLREREREGKWSPLEILAHLRDEEIEDFGKRAKAAVEGSELELNVDPESWVTEKRYNEMDPGAVYLDFAKLRADWCRWLEDLSLDDLRKSAEHPVMGTVSAGDFIAAWRVHDLLHLRQLTHALAVLHARRYEGYKVEYAGTITPST